MLGNLAEQTLKVDWIPLGLMLPSSDVQKGCYNVKWDNVYPKGVGSHYLDKATCWTMGPLRKHSISDKQMTHM